MNKTELIEAISQNAELNKSEAGRSLDSILKIITDKLSSGDDVSLVGFGTFSTSKRAARTGRNPQTGKPIEIPSTTVAKFKPGKSLKDAVNN